MNGVLVAFAFVVIVLVIAAIFVPMRRKDGDTRDDRWDAGHGGSGGGGGCGGGCGGGGS